MKTLSLLQPWATLVVIGAKRFETRSWATSYRGPLLIHASKKWPLNERIYWGSNWGFCAAVMPLGFWMGNSQVHLLQVVPVGVIVGRVDLVDCVPTDDLTVRDLDVERRPDPVLKAGDWYSWTERMFGNFSPGRYAWRLENPIRFDCPIPAKGSLGIWEFPESSLGHLAERQ